MFDWSSLFVEALGADVFEMEKPVVYKYEDIFASTDEFSDSNLLGNGTYGSVYYGLLHDQVFTDLYLTFFLIRYTVVQSIIYNCIKKIGVIILLDVLGGCC